MILDSQGNPVKITSSVVRQNFEGLGGGSGKNHGYTLMSRFAGNKDINKFKRLAADIETANPAIRSPLLNQSNFFMPESDSSTGEPNRLMNQWIMYYYRWHPLCGNLIQLHSTIGKTSILTDSGVRNIEDITGQDKVLSSSGGWQSVQWNETHKFSGTLISIRGVGSLEEEYTYNHPIKIVSGGRVQKVAKDGQLYAAPDVTGLPMWVPAERIKKGDYLVIPRFRHYENFGVLDLEKYLPFYVSSQGQPIYDIVVEQGVSYLRNLTGFPKKMIPRFIPVNEDLAELLGWYVAEGSASGGYKIQFSLNKEKDPCDRVFSLIKSIFGIEPVMNYKGAVCSIDFGSHILYNFFTATCGRGAENKMIPRFVYANKDSILRSFLKAYILGDGCVVDCSSGNGGYVQCVTISKTLAYQLRMFCTKLDFLFGIRYYETKRVHSKKCADKPQWILTCVKQDISQVLYGTPLVVKKPSATKKDSENFYVPVTRIKSRQYCGAVYDIKTDDHSFLTTFVVHNSEIPLSRFALRGIEDPKILSFYENMVESAELHVKMVELLRQYFLFGEVLPFAFWSDNYNCFTDLTFLDSNYVYVKGHYLLHSDEGDDVEFYELEADPLLINIVKSDDYVNTMLRGYLGEEFVSAVRQNKRLLLSNFSTYMIKHRARWSDLRGTAMLLRCLKSLLYNDKLRESQYVVADGHVNPKWIWKIGQAGDLTTGGYMPSEEDLQAFRDLLVEANNDPLFTIITHYAVNVDAVGLNGKLLPLAQEYSQIENDILTALFSNKAITTGEGPNYACYDEETETLTENGFKKIDDIVDGEKIATFNPATECLEYHLPISKHIYDYDSGRDGELVRFKTGKIDVCVTPNHRMYTKKRYGSVWGIERADEVRPRAYFRSQVKWEGIYHSVPKEVKRLFGTVVSLDDWCELVGYFLSEGWTVYKKRDHRVGIRQMPTSVHYSKMRNLCEKLGFRIYKDSFILYNKDAALYFRDTFGTGSAKKRVPKWMKSLPTPYLSVLLNAMVDGDGNRRPNTRKKDTSNLYYSYCSVSKTLADDVYELAFKLGYVPKATADKSVKEGYNRRHYVAWSDSDTGRYPCLDSRNKAGNPVISREAYKGRVYCFEVPNHLFITRRGGVVTIQGNTASVAFRAMMSRYIPIRARVERYLYQKIFAPVAYANKFFTRKKADLAHHVRTGDEESNKLAIPQIDWRSKANLLDDGSVKSIISSMVNSGRLPMKILCEALDLDYTEVRNYLFSEQGTIFDSITQNARKVLTSKNTDETMMGQPFAPKTNQPVSTKSQIGKAVQPQAKKAAGKLDDKRRRLLSVKPLTLPKDPIQTQIDKGKPEKGGNPKPDDPMKESLKLGAEAPAPADSDTEPKNEVRVFDTMGGGANEKYVKHSLIKKKFENRKVALKNALVDMPAKKEAEKEADAESSK